jgi:gliding motility-associated-like protein
VLPIDTQPLVTTTFDFMVTDGCTTPPAFASSTVTVHELPQVIIQADPDSGCHPLTVDFSDLTQPTPIGWNWNFGDPDAASNTAAVENPIHLYSGAGTYDVSLSITTAEGCVTDSVFTDFIEVFPLPYASFTLDPNIINLVDANISFTDHSQGQIIDWSWNFGDGTNSSNQNPTHLYSDTGTFIINLLVTTDHGCTDETSRELIVEPDFMFYVPNAFTPNSNGINDGFRGYGEGIKWDTYQMSIFDRWGELIYYTEDINDPWDGTYRGLQVEVSVYVWKIRFYDINGDDHDYYGHVTLVR